MPGCTDGFDVGTTIFSNNPGKIVTVEGNSTPVTFTVDNDQDTFHNLKAIVTSVGVSAQSGYQFMHTLREFIYVYVFSERIGEITISGLAFPVACDSFGPQALDPGAEVSASGLERVLTWAQNNRMTTRANPITIILGSGSAVIYKAFLVASKVDLVNPEAGIAQFSFRFNYIPNISEGEDFCLPSSESDCTDTPCEEGGGEG